MITLQLAQCWNPTVTDQTGDTPPAQKENTTTLENTTK